MNPALCIDDIVGTSLSGRPAPVRWAPNSEGSQDRLFCSILDSVTKHLEALQTPHSLSWGQFTAATEIEIEPETWSVYFDEAMANAPAVEIEPITWNTDIHAMVYSVPAAGIELKSWTVVNIKDAMACAKSYQDVFQGAIVYCQQQTFNDYVNAILENDVPNASRIVSRLQSLLEMTKDDEPDNPMPVNIESLGSMAKFFIASKIRRYPDIALSRDGMCFVEWHDSSFQSLTLQFLADGAVQAVWTTQPDRDVPHSEHAFANKSVENTIDFLRRLEALPE